MGHRDLLVTHNLSERNCHHCSHHPRGSVRRASGFVLTDYSSPIWFWKSAGLTARNSGAKTDRSLLRVPATDQRQRWRKWKLGTDLALSPGNCHV